MRHKTYLDVEQEVHYVAIFNDVVFTFCTHLASFFRALFTFIGDEIFKREWFARG